jgi:hypothetical protein
MTQAKRSAVLVKLLATVVSVVGCSSDPGVNEDETPGLASDGTATSSATGMAATSIGAPSSTGQSTAVPATSSSTSTTSTSSGSPATTVPEDPNAVPDTAPPTELAATPRLARLSRKQWSNSVRQLLRLEDISQIDSLVSGDALIGFDTEADALYVTEQLRRELADAAESLAARVVADTGSLALLEPSDVPTEPTARARAFVEGFGLRAFRRPLTTEEVDVHMSLFGQGAELYPDLDPFAAGAALVIQAMLQSPHFLYRTELSTGDGGGTPVPLNDYEVASKLAFALTNTMPTDELLAAAAAGALSDRAAIREHAVRLIDGPSGVDGIANFNFQVLRLGTYEGIRRDSAIFPDFTPETPESMRQEVLHFLEWAFRGDLGVKDYYTSPVGFVNSALAPLYGLEGEFARDTFTQVDLDPSQRAGLLTQAGFLSSYISDTDPDIIHRGVFIATRLLCMVLPPPDPNATSLIEIQPDMTNRERVEATTGKGTCGENCHSLLLNPLGYAFENYDAVGKHRLEDRGLPVDAAATYTLDGKTESFTNGVELSHLLAEAKQTHKCYAQNMLTYLNGRPLANEDTAIVDYYARLSRAGMISVRDLALAMVTSDAFLTRLP